MNIFQPTFGDVRSLIANKRWGDAHRIDLWKLKDIHPHDAIAYAREAVKNVEVPYRLLAFPHWEHCKFGLSVRGFYREGEVRLSPGVVNDHALDMFYTLCVDLLPLTRGTFHAGLLDLYQYVKGNDQPDGSNTTIKSLEDVLEHLKIILRRVPGHRFEIEQGIAQFMSMYYTTACERSMGWEFPATCAKEPYLPQR